MTKFNNRHFVHRRRDLSFDEKEKIRRMFVDHFQQSQSTKPKRRNETQILIFDSTPQNPGNGTDSTNKVLATVPLIRPDLGSNPKEETPTG
jgi:hypothetical protein